MNFGKYLIGGIVALGFIAPIAQASFWSDWFPQLFPQPTQELEPDIRLGAATSTIAKNLFIADLSGNGVKCLQITNAGLVQTSTAACGSGSGSSTVAFYANGQLFMNSSTVNVSSGPNIAIATTTNGTYVISFSGILPTANGGVNEDISGFDTGVVYYSGGGAAPMTGNSSRLYLNTSPDRLIIGFPSGSDGRGSAGISWNGEAFASGTWAGNSILGCGSTSTYATVYNSTTAKFDCVALPSAGLTTWLAQGMAFMQSSTVDFFGGSYISIATTTGGRYSFSTPSGTNWDAAYNLRATTTIPLAANPSASVGLSVVNGSAATFMRSDGAPALSQTITPVWTGLHQFSGAGASTTQLRSASTTLGDIANAIAVASGTGKLYAYPGGTATCGGSDQMTSITWSATGTPSAACSAQGSGSGAPTDAAYIIIGPPTSSLSAERQLGVGFGLTLTDGGANASATLAANTSSLQLFDAFLDDISDLTDPGADRIVFWDESDNIMQWLSADATLSISATTISVVDVTCTGCLGSTEVAGLDISADTNLTAGDYITLTDDDLDVDPELASTTLAFVFYDATSTAPYKFQKIRVPYAMTLSEVYCDEYAGATTTVQLHRTTANGTTTNAQTYLSSIACGINGTNTASFTSSSVTANTWLVAVVSSTAGTPSLTSITIHGKKTD